jgi:hypothetical protein
VKQPEVLVKYQGAESSFSYFPLEAIKLFACKIVVKLVNKLRENGRELAQGRLAKEQKKELKANGIKISDKAAVEAYFAEKKRLADEAAAAEAAAAAEKARLEREANPTVEDLLKQILAQIQK